MESVFMGKVRRSGNSLVITIPKGIAKGLGLGPGDEVKVVVKKGGDMD